MLDINIINELFKTCQPMTQLSKEDVEILDNSLDWEVLKSRGINSFTDEGISKYAIVMSDIDCVLKIPFNGMKGIYEKWNSAKETYERNSKGHIVTTETFYPFTDADSDYGDNYCEAELRRYEAAVEAGLDFLFAPVEYITTVNGYKIYSQPCCTMFFSKHDSVCTDEATTAYSICSENHYDCFNECWLTEVLEEYGEQTFIKFMDFLEEYAINDLHADNVGYYNGKPVLVDYSGYWE